MTHAEFKKRFMPLQQMLYREAYRMLGDSFEAEDAVQNLYVKLWEKKEQLDAVDVPPAYCRTMLKNICIDRWRVLRMREENDVPIDNAVEGNVSPDSDEGEVEEFVAHFLAGLSQQQRQVMQMSMLGCGCDEIARVTGLSEVNVRVILSRLRKKFREYYYE